MADTTKAVLSVIGTTSSMLSSLVISNGQLIFVQDTHKVALDFNDKRVFYNQITELDTESDRTNLLAPVSDSFYFVIGTSVLWRYQDDEWVQITSPPKEVVVIGTDIPELGSENTLYVNTDACEISVWDAEASKFIIVSNKTEAISEDEISLLFE